MKKWLMSWFGKHEIEEKEESVEDKDMFIIVGLGNPTAQYVGTRHNVGFEVIDVLADKYSIEAEGKKFKAYVGKGMIKGHKVLLAKPQTYMNLSGQSVRSMVDFYKIDESSKLIVIYDDVSLDVGQIRIRERGSSGGQKGMSSIINHLGTQDFIRIRMGVGEKPSKMSLSNYVLSQFTKEEREIMEESFVNATEAIVDILDGNVTRAMNTWNKQNLPQRLAGKEKE